MIQWSAVDGGDFGRAVFGHPSFSHQRILIENLFVLCAVVHLHRALGHPLVQVVVLRGRQEGATGCHQGFEHTRLHDVLGGAVEVVVDHVSAGLTIEHRGKTVGIRRLEDFRKVHEDVAIGLLPRQQEVGQVGRVGVLVLRHTGGQLCARHVIGSAHRGRSSQWEDGFLLHALGHGHGGVAPLGVSAHKVLSVERNAQLVLQRHDGLKQGDAGLRF